ncbi:MAG: ABC transporter ATP-binding protein [Ignisphaera sp.]
MSTILEVENLTKIYEIGYIRKRRITAVDKVSFSVRKGEIISLVGESGSGKTTTARMILRLIKPTSGAIKFMGRDIWRDLKSNSDLRWYWRNVNGVFQDPFSSFNPTHRIRDFMYRAFNLFNERLDTNAKDKLVREALQMVGLIPDEVLNRRPFELSGGMRQRVMIARIFLIRPMLVLADEPTSMIDATLRLGILKLFSKLREEIGTAIIFITHDMGLAYYISDRIMIMYRGKIIEEGTPDEIVNSPKHEYTRNLLDSIPKLYTSWFG